MGSVSLVENGREPLKVAQRLNKLLRGETVYSDAWSFDVCWLGKLYEKVGVPQLNRIDTLHRLVSEQQSRLWHPVKEERIRGFDLCRQRASTDALVLQETFLRTRALSETRSRTAS